MDRRPPPAHLLAPLALLFILFPPAGFFAVSLCPSNLWVLCWTGSWYSLCLSCTWTHTRQGSLGGTLFHTWPHWADLLPCRRNCCAPAHEQPSQREIWEEIFTAHSAAFAHLAATMGPPLAYATFWHSGRCACFVRPGELACSTNRSSTPALMRP
jgi:hypothetical protein